MKEINIDCTLNFHIIALIAIIQCMVGNEGLLRFMKVGMSIMFIDSKTVSNMRVFRQFYEYYIGRNMIIFLLKTVYRLEKPGPDEKQPGEESSQSP